MTNEDDPTSDTVAQAELESVLEAVRTQVDPDADERARLSEAARVLTERATAAALERCPEADVLRAGSTARNTWLSGDRDIDIFVRFPPAVDRDTLEQYGLEVGHETLPEGHEEYAEHPYVKGQYDGFDIDIVPCFRLESATDIRSAVDRTPFHTQYLEARLTEALTAAVRLTKQFMKGIGVYGSDLRTRGFSGYLTELLVCEYGGFLPLLEAAADWQPPIRLDPESHGEASFTDPLVVIDPTDPTRNVAAVCSGANVARFQHYARAFLADPRVSLFERTHPEALTATALSTHLERRGTTPVAIRLTPPAIVDDQLYPQLEKSLDGVTSGLIECGFEVIRATTFADETAVLFAELATDRLPAIEPHSGPPVHVRHHAEGFYGAYADDPDTYGPFIHGDRYLAERTREFTTARAFLESEQLFDVGLGARIETALKDEYEVFVGTEITALLPEFGTDLARYFDPRP